MDEALKIIIAKLESFGLQLERIERRQEEHNEAHDRGDYRRPVMTPANGGRHADR